ncbi:ATP-binding cassette domain-containing protein [Microbacterium enclense]|uniref:ATP-binding cassette domain-containing protein n=1 Tax=Microbacterium enclense TaxID=993073 RepID=UPI003F7D7C9E
MTASLPELPESSSSETEGVAASAEPAVTPAPKPRAPRSTSAKRPPARAKGDDASDSGDVADATGTPAPKPRAPRSPRTASTARATAGGGRTPAAGGRTPAAGGRTPAAKKTAAAAKKPATPRSSAAKKPATPRGSAGSATGTGTAGAVSIEGAETLSVSETEAFARDSAGSETKAGAVASAPTGDVETPTAPQNVAGPESPQATTMSDSAVTDEGPTTASEADAVPASSTAASATAFEDIVIPPRPPLPVLGTVGLRSSTDDHTVEDVTPADVAVEEPVTSGPDASLGDLAPADVAVEEPVTLGPEASVDHPETPSGVASESESAEPRAAEVEVVVETPLEVDRNDGSAVGVGPATVAERADDGEADSSSVDDAQDPTPPDVRAEDPAPIGDAPVSDAADEKAAVAGLSLDDPQDSTPPDARADDTAPAEARFADAADAVTTDEVDPGVADTDAADADVAGTDAADVDVADTDAADVEVVEADAADADVVAADSAEIDTTAAPDESHASDASETTAVLPASASVSPEGDGDADPDAAADADAEAAVPVLTLRHITKTFGDLRAVDAIDLTVPAGSFYGLVGPNGAGKTTTLSIIAGLLRADAGEVTINGVDATKRAREAKKLIGVLPDRLRTFDRLTGRQLLSYYGALRGLPSGLVESRMADLARAFDLVDALARPVSDYSAGMTKKVMLAGAMIHSPRLLVLDEPFEAVDPVSSGVILDILRTYVEHGGTVILSSHGMELVERVCSRVAVIVSGQVLAEGTVDEVRGEGTLEERFRELSGGLGDVEGLEWLHTFSA